MNKKITKFTSKFWPYLVFLVGACILLSFQFVNKAVSTSVDSYFHFSRIYDASRQIRTGNWGLLTNFAFQQSGRIVNGVYGPVLAYFLGLLALIFHSWLRLQMAAALLLYMGAACGMYLLSMRLTGKQVLSTVITLCYLAFSPLTAWPTMANFQAVSAALAPWAVLCCARMVVNRQAPISWLSLGIFMAVCAQLHMLDCLIFGSAMFIFAIVGFVLTDHKKDMVLNLLFAVVLFLFLSVNIWLPILHFTGSNAMSTPLAFDLAEHTWSLGGIYHYLGDTFTVIFVLAAVANLVYVLCHWHCSVLNNVLAFTGSFYLLAASKYFPWQSIQKTWPTLKTSFQSPRRLAALAIALLLASFAITLSQISQK